MVSSVCLVSPEIDIRQQQQVSLHLTVQWGKKPSHEVFTGQCMPSALLRTLCYQKGTSWYFHLKRTYGDRQRCSYLNEDLLSCNQTTFVIPDYWIACKCCDCMAWMLGIKMFDLSDGICVSLDWSQQGWDWMEHICNVIESEILVKRQECFNCGGWKNFESTSFANSAYRRSHMNLALLYMKSSRLCLTQALIWASILSTFFS